jgi:DamX protein
MAAAPVTDGGNRPAATGVSQEPAVGKPAAAGPSNLLESRLAATREWLAGESQNKLSIQLMGTNDPEQLKNLLNTMGKSIEINKIFVYRTVAKQKPSLTVLYGSFDNTRAAREALDKLPASLRANRPILRTVQGIRAEIKQHQAS